MVNTDWQSCCRGKGSCPQVKLENNEIYIKDDFGNIVHLPIAQLSDVIHKLTMIMHMADPYNRP